MESIHSFFSYVEQYPVTGTAIWAIIVTLLTNGFIGIVKYLIHKLEELHNKEIIGQIVFARKKNIVVTSVNDKIYDTKSNNYIQRQHIDWSNMIGIKRYLFISYFYALNNNSKLCIHLRIKNKDRSILINWW